MTNPGDKLAAAREQVGLTQGALGKAIGVDQTTVSAYEVGEIKCPPDERLEQIAWTLGRPPNEVRGWWGLAPTATPKPSAVSEFIARMKMDNDLEELHENLRTALDHNTYAQVVNLLLARHKAELGLLQLVAQALKI